MAINDKPHFNGGCTFPQCMCISEDQCRYKFQNPAGYAGVPSKPQREGDQPMPVRNSHPAVWPIVMRDMMDRHELGIKRYGTPLQPHNGRDMLLDAYQEVLDLAVYLRGAIYERDGK